MTTDTETAAAPRDTQTPPANPAHPADRRRRASDLQADAVTPGRAVVSDKVSFQVRRLEPYLAWVLAIYVLWVTVVSTTLGASVWYVALIAACIGGWSRVYPAQKQVMLLGRAVLLILATLVLQLVPGLGGPTGPFFYTLLMIGVFYALLLATPWAMLVSLLAVVEFAMACWLAETPPSWQTGLIQGGSLVLMLFLATTFGRSIRLADTRVESNLRDTRTLLYNETGFFVHGALLLADCQKRSRPFSMVLLNGASLRDMPERVGRKMTNDLYNQIVQGIGKVPGEGIAARTDTVEFALLLPGVTRERAAALVRQQLGEQPKVEVMMSGKPVTVMLDMAITQSNSKDRTIEGLYDMMHAYLAKREQAGLSNLILGADAPGFDPNATTNIVSG